MRILILSSMVAGSMAACTSGNADMIVFSGFSANTTADDDYATNGQFGTGSAVLTVREVFANTACETSRAAGNGNLQGVPWPLASPSGATTGYNSNASTATDFAIEIVLNNAGGTVPVANALSIRFDTAAVTDHTTGATCAAPQIKFYTNLDGNTGEIASPSVGAGYLKAAWLAAAGTEIAASGLALYGKDITAAGDALASHYVTANTFKQIKVNFFTNADCSTAVTASATAIATQKMAIWTNSDATTSHLTVPGRCVNVKKDVSFEFYCNVPGGFITHIGYANNGCTGTAVAANTTTWTYGAVATLTTAEKCQSWKGLGTLSATLSNSAGVLLTTNTLFQAVCPHTTTAAPTAAPASGAAAVGTAAAVAAGAAALIL